MFESVKTGQYYGLPEEPFNFESVSTWISALDEARRLKSSRIDTGHLLVAFLYSKATIVEDFQSFFGLIDRKELELRNGLAYQALRSSGANLKDARRHLIDIIGYGDTPYKIKKLVGRIPLDERPNSAGVSLAAKRAAAWSQKLGTAQIGDQHLLLGLLDEPDAVITELLKKMCIDADKLRQSILDLVNQKSID
ncbi:MAG: hypothetical protein K8F91_24865 [Candidatus Obscuribacterales bacterium]|nr:hypothetical protein [Candidatus Obscuribacterales bacterium]